MSTLFLTRKNGLPSPLTLSPSRLDLFPILTVNTPADATRLRLFRDEKGDCEDTVDVVGVDPVRVQAVPEQDLSPEGAVRALGHGPPPPRRRAVAHGSEGIGSGIAVPLYISQRPWRPLALRGSERKVGGDVV